MAALPQDMDFQAIIRAGRAAPLDPEDLDGNRYRTFGGVHFYPWEPERGYTIVPCFKDPDSGRTYSRYAQPANINPEAGGRVRRFAPIPEYLWSSLWPLINVLYMGTPHELVSRTDPVAAHVHLVSMRPRQNWAAYSVPNLLHQDLDPVTFVVLTERSENAGGGQSLIAKASTARHKANWQDLPDGEIIEKFTLVTPWSGVAVWDSRVSHAVSPLYGTDGEPANRTALLIDFTNIPI